jgi:uroporphyrinogen-III decarboxylase
LLNADDKTFGGAVIDRLQIGKPGSGYILSTACRVAPYVSPERLKKLIVLGRFGDNIDLYPIDNHLI